MRVDKCTSILFVKISKLNCIGCEVSSSTFELKFTKNYLGERGLSHPLTGPLLTGVSYMFESLRYFCKMWKIIHAYFTKFSEGYKNDKKIFSQDP